MPVTSDPARPFGRLLTAMVTPFGVDGSLDLAAATRLATYLVDEQGNDGLVVNGTTGESPTTSDGEKADLIAAVVDAVGDRAHIVAGIGTFDTVHTVHLAEQAAKAGATGVLVVTPYYSKPPQAGLLMHFRAVADASELPVMLYDIPGRTATADRDRDDDRARRARAHRRRQGREGRPDGYLAGAGRDRPRLLLRRRRHDAADAGRRRGRRGRDVDALQRARHQGMIEAYERGDVTSARALHRALLPIYSGIFRTQGCILVKAGLKLRGLEVGPVRAPLVDATEHEISHLRQDLAAAGL